MKGCRATNSRFAVCRGRRAFSLLEVIIATGILAASALMLMSLFSTGDRHTKRADERTMAQMLCQSKLDELLAEPAQVMPMKANVFRQYPGWVWSLDVQPSGVAGFVRLHVSVTRIPGMETGANLELATNEETTDATALPTIPDEPTFDLVRWTKFEGDVSGFGDADAYSGGDTRSGDTFSGDSFSGGGF